MLDKKPGKRRLPSKSRSLYASNAAAVAHNPHSISKPARAFLLVGFVADAAHADSSHKP